MKKPQKGFSAVEGLLIVIAITLVAFVGYYVWHTQNQTNKTLDITAKTSDSTVNAAKSKPATDPNKGYFVIKEWGVRAKYSGNLALTYSYDSKNQQANFNSEQLKASDPAACTDGIDGGGYIVRYAPSDHFYTSDEGSDMGTAASYFKDMTKDNYKYLGSYYYFYVHPQAPCSENVDLGTQTDNAVKTLMQNLEATPN